MKIIIYRNHLFGKEDFESNTANRDFIIFVFLQFVRNHWNKYQLIKSKNQKYL